MSNISEFFDEKVVLITGSSGFVGKCLLEKILRSTHVTTVYCLLRPKTGKTAERRLQELLSESLFSNLSSEQLSKAVPLSGDITLPEMGLNPMERENLFESIQLVFNCAATIRFDEPIRRALQLNVISVQRVLRLCLKMTRIEALVHVSTAYCTPNMNDVREETPRETSSAQKLLDSVEWMDDKILSAITPHLLSGRHSTYHFSKALAEQLLAEQKEGLPVAIVRPSIIVGAMREPSNGWIDNYNGISGYLVAVGKGVLRTLHCKPHFKCDVIPVDIVVNTCLSSAYSVATKRPEKALVVNCVSGPLNGVTWRQINAICIPLLCETPSEELFRVPGVTLHSSSWVHFCHLVVEHRIPAFVVDLLFRSFGLKPILGQVYNKVNRSVAALEYFTCNQWSFKCENFKKLTDEMSRADRDLYGCDVTQIDWNLFFRNFILAIRLLLLKENNESIPNAKQKLQKYLKKKFFKSFQKFF